MVGLSRLVSRRAVRRALHAMAGKIYAAVTKPFLTRSQVSRRLAWARVHSGWTLESCAAVGFSEESSFKVHLGKEGARVWRRSNER